MGKKMSSRHYLGASFLRLIFRVAGKFVLKLLSRFGVSNRTYDIEGYLVIPKKLISGDRLYHNGDYFIYLDISIPTEFARVFNLFEPDVYQAFSAIVREGDLVVDIGAHKGTYTLLAASKVGQNGRVISFEPDMRTLNCLNKSINVNRYHNIETYNYAVLKGEGEAKLLTHHVQSVRLDLASGGGSIPSDYVYVKAVSLRQFCQEKNIKLINIVKIDVEGTERIILEDLDTDDVTIEYMIVELHKEILPNKMKDINSIFAILSKRYQYIYGFNRQNGLLRKMASPTYFNKVVDSGNIRHILASKYDISPMLLCTGICVKA